MENLTPIGQFMGVNVYLETKDAAQIINLKRSVLKGFGFQLSDDGTVATVIGSALVLPSFGGASIATTPTGAGASPGTVDESKDEGIPPA